MALERVLVVNVGSSSFKWSSLDPGGKALGGASEPWVPSLDAAVTQVERALRTAGRPSAIGHRIVHGGPAFIGPVRLDAAVRAKLEELRVLAARHMAPALACLDACTRVLPEVPQICAFDTAFHAALPDEARTYAVPRAWRDALALRRYGFHGLSVAWSVRRTAELLGALPPRIVVCHLGSGCSVTAVRDGRSVDTSMGYTPLDGVVMATRAGQLDPGAVLAIAEHLGTGRADVEGRLESQCGLLALAGTADLKAILERRERGDAVAAAAYAVYLHALLRAVGAATGVIGGLDVLVFTGGAGEHSAPLRADLCGGLAFLGVALDRGRNDAPGDHDIDLAQPGAPARVLRIEAREDLEILAAVRRLVD